MTYTEKQENFVFKRINFIDSDFENELLKGTSDKNPK